MLMIYPRTVRPKSAKIAAMVAEFEGRDLDPRYLCYFHCFNRQQFYEAHDALEGLWLERRHETDGPFFKGLIQLAGAFVHLQKHRLQPAAALLKLAHTNLSQFPACHWRLNLTNVLSMIELWMGRLKVDQHRMAPLPAIVAPRLTLETAY